MNNVDDRIHFVIFYKRIVRRFLRYFRKRYLRIKQFNDNFTVEKDFKLLIKEEHELELEKGHETKLTNSNYYALQLYPNALQAKLQSRR